MTNTEKSKSVEAIYESLLVNLKKLSHELVSTEEEFEKNIKKVHDQHAGAAINLVHYLGLRRQDLRKLQTELANVGLSSLGRSESKVLPTIHSIIYLLESALNAERSQTSQIQYENNPFLEKNSLEVFGAPPSDRNVRILVTLPSEAANEYSLVKRMLLKGMDCARINCAHDDEEVWLKMIKNIERACAETHKDCKVLMDLSGPKLRTGEISAELSVLKIKPKKNNYGHVVSPAKIFIHSSNKSISMLDKSLTLPVDDDWLKDASVNDAIFFKDARKSNREIKLLEKTDDGFWGEISQTAYVTPQTELRLLMMGRTKHPRYHPSVAKVGKLPNLQKMIFLHKGDTLIINRKDLPGKPAEYSENGQLMSHPSISCSLPEIFHMVSEGERILFDDGRIGGVIRKVKKDTLSVEITEITDNGDKLLADKGINLPDSNLTLDAITDADIKNLQFVVKHADMVGFSFSKNTKDIELIQKNLKELGADNLALVLKVETRSAFEKLPQMLLTLMRSPKVAIMIARGDLAVECGYERLAELQEEILCLAEAAHIPVIWATQVLESLAKTGKPSRAEISDAVMAERAECVMLNKGAHILEAIEMLVDILKRMQGFQNKKRSLLRQLHW